MTGLLLPFCYLALPELMRGITVVCMTMVLIIPIRWKFEIEADEFARSLVGVEPVVSAFNVLLSLKGADDPSFSHPPIRNRIESLQKNS